MRKRTRDFGHLELIAIFLLVAVLLPGIINAIRANATNELGSFETGETGIKLCAIVNGGLEDNLRFSVTNDQGFAADVLVENNTCRKITTVAANYTIKQYVAQEYTLDEVTGGTVSGDGVEFPVVSTGQYAIIYENTYGRKPYLHNFGYTLSKANATAAEVIYDANGGTGQIAPQRFGLNAEGGLSANTFTREGYTFGGWNTKADGTGTSYINGQAVTFASGGEMTLYAQWNEIPHIIAHNVVANQANPQGIIEFERGTIVSDNSLNANGNGVNIYKENNQNIYYFRGQVSNNNVIWANKCWKIVRTTSTGGVKMIYNGAPSDVMVGNETVQQCNATGESTRISLNGRSKFMFNEESANVSENSPADSGYMYGARIQEQQIAAGSANYTFANDVTRSGNIYTLSASAVTGTWADKRVSASSKYHYFCTDGSTSCDNTKIGYISYFGDSSYIHYLPVDGYDDIEAMKTAMFTNTNDSVAKSTVESWFEQENLDGYEDDLEDTVFCNDRSFYSGSLKSKDDGNTKNSYRSAVLRTALLDEDNDYTYVPSLDCANKNDAFTKSDTTRGNAKLAHKVGLITADELTIAGMHYRYYNDLDGSNYLYSGLASWTATPSGYGAGDSSHWDEDVFVWMSYLDSNNVYQGSDYVNNGLGLRPMVSLKTGTEFKNNGADGTATNPYIVK